MRELRSLLQFPDLVAGSLASALPLDEGEAAPPDPSAARTMRMLADLPDVKDPSGAGMRLLIVRLRFDQTNRLMVRRRIALGAAARVRA